MSTYQKKIEQALVKLECSEAVTNRKYSLSSAIRTTFNDIEESKKRGVTYREIANEIGVEYRNFITAINRIKKKMSVKNNENIVIVYESK